MREEITAGPASIIARHCAAKSGRKGPSGMAGRGPKRPVVALDLFPALSETELAALFAGRWENRWIAATLSGLRPAVVAIIAGAALRLGFANLRSPWPWLAAAAGAGLMLAKILAPVPLILLGAAAGLALHLVRRRKEPAP